MPIGKVNKEIYPYHFLEIDKSDINYHNILQGVKKESKDSIFEYSYDAEYFFNMAEKVINESSVESSNGFEIVCHSYGVNGY